MSELIHASHNIEPAHDHILPVKTYLKVYVALMVLLVATVGAAFVNIEPFNFALTMVIAIAKAVMILLIFMHVR
jgi:cytochrome c oxidase subunit IV